MHGQPGTPIILGGHSLRAKLADHMLRYSLFQPNVDRLIVSMRKAEWVQANVASWLSGPLSGKERAWLEDMVAAR